MDPKETKKALNIIILLLAIITGLLAGLGFMVLFLLFRFIALLA